MDVANCTPEVATGDPLDRAIGFDTTVFVVHTAGSPLTRYMQSLRLHTTRDPLIDCWTLFINRRGRDLSFFYALVVRPWCARRSLGLAVLALATVAKTVG